MTIIRAARLSDRPQLSKLAGQTISRVRLVANQWPGKTVHMFVAECDGQCVGFIRVRIVEQGRRPTRAWWKRVSTALGSFARPEADLLVQLLRFGLVEQLVVAPAWRRQGIGTTLVDSAIRWLQQQAVPELQLALGAELMTTQNFWLQLGFQPRQLLLRKRLETDGQPLTAAIRPATQKDLPELAELVRQEVQHQQAVAQSFHLLPNIDWVAYVTACLDDPNTQILVATQESRLVGYVDTRCIQPGQHGVRNRLLALARTRLASGRKQPLGVVEDVYVLPELRQQGIASALARHSFDWFQRRRILEIQAAVWANNTPSLHFFHHLGFACRTRLMSRRM